MSGCVHRDLPPSQGGRYAGFGSQSGTPTAGPCHARVFSPCPLTRQNDDATPGSGAPDAGYNGGMSSSSGSVSRGSGGGGQVEYFSRKGEENASRPVYVPFPRSCHSEPGPGPGPFASPLTFVGEHGPCGPLLLRLI